MEAAGYCVKCGSPFYVNDLYCGQCGYKLGERKCPLCGGIIDCEKLAAGMNTSANKTFVPSKASPNIPVPQSDSALLNNKPISDNSGAIENTASSQSKVDDFKKTIDIGFSTVDHASQSKLLPNEILKPDAMPNPNEMLKPAVNTSGSSPRISIPSDSEVPEDQREALIMKVRLKLNPNSVPDIPDVPAIPQALGHPILAPERAGASPVRPYLKTMTLAQLTANANAGDPHAMFRLGLFYDFLDNEVEIDGVRPAAEARNWYKKAVMAGHGQALFAVCDFGLTLVELFHAVMPTTYSPKDKEVIEQARETYNWFSRGLELFRKRAPGTEVLNYQKFKENADRASYYLATSLWFTDENEALKLVCNHADPASQILTLVIYEDKRQDWIKTRGDEDQAMWEEHKKRIKKMLALVLDEKYKAEQKMFCESLFYADAAILVAESLCYEAKSKDSAISFLNSAKIGVTSDNAKSIIDKKLAEYYKL